MLNKASVQLVAFLQATGLVIYLGLLALFFNNVVPNLDESANEVYAPIVMLLLFIISAVITSSLVLGRAGVLFWDKKYAQAFRLVAWTVGWCLLYFSLLVAFLFVQ